MLGSACSFDYERNNLRHCMSVQKCIVYKHSISTHKLALSNGSTQAPTWEEAGKSTSCTVRL